MKTTITVALYNLLTKEGKMVKVEGKLYKFPSSFREASRIERAKAVKFGETYWVVGNDALSSGGSADYVKTEEDLVKLYPLFLLSVAKREGIEVDKNNPIKVIVSLPLDTYLFHRQLQKEGRENLITRLINNSREYGFDPVVRPQGISALEYILEKGIVNLKKGEEKREGNILLIDGGFNTVNVAVVSPKMEVLYVKTFVDEAGVRKLLEDFFVEELKEQGIPVSSNLVAIKEVFISGKVPIGLRDVDITPQKEKATKRFIDRFKRKVFGELERARVNFEQIAIVGGLSYYIKKDDFDTDKEVFIPSEKGEFFNVLGLSRYHKLE